MELRHLRYFLTVADQGTVTAAAARLHVAQPAISRQLQSLERDLGVALFTRQGPRLLLTDAGRQMLEIARDIVTRADRATMMAQQMAHGSLARLTVAAGPTTIDYVLAPFVAELTDVDPFVSVDAVAPDKVHDAVLAGHDLGISGTSPPTSPLAWKALTSVPLRAYVSASHPWATRQTVSIDELLETALILPPRSDPTRLVLDDAITAAGLANQGYDEVPSPPLRQALAAAGRCVTVATDLERFGARPVFITHLTGEVILLTIHACWSTTHYAAAALEAFADRLAAFSDSVVRTQAESFET
jgi:DNA-binding transcriptional LysR family regulator